MANSLALQMNGVFFYATVVEMCVNYRFTRHALA